jgi:hypothetical protein
MLSVVRPFNDSSYFSSAAGFIGLHTRLAGCFTACSAGKNKVYSQ